MKMKDQMRSREREALQHLLECCGADRTRWPAPERLRFAPLLVEDAEARRMVAEAAALDRLIDLAPLVSERRQAALVDRIVEEAGGLPRASKPGVAVIRRSNGSGNAFRRALPMTGGSARMRTQWPAAMLLAASLVLGIFAGTTRTVERVLAPLAVATGLQSVEGDPLRMALGDEISGLGVEELL